MAGLGSQSVYIPVAFAIALTFDPSALAQPVIEHGDVDCLPRGEFTEILTSIQPPSTVRTAKLYFRSQLYPEFYFVELSPSADGVFKAVLPLPSAETSAVVYYIEAVDISFQTARTEELSVSVSDDGRCRRGPGGQLFPGSPAIIVGATQAGAAAIPAGFQATGITGFLTATGGIAATGGGGIGVGVAVGAVAGAAAGVGVVLSGGGETASTTTVPPVGGGGTPSTSIATSSTTTTTGATTTISGGPTTTTASGPSTTSIPSTSSIPSTTAPTTTIQPSTTTTTEPSLTACFEWRALGSCRVFFDSCSTPESAIQRYEWRMLGTPVPEPPQVDNFTFSFEADPRCLGTMNFNYPVRLTVFDGPGRSASIQQNVSVRPGATQRTNDGANVKLSFKSQLVVSPADGRARGQIVVNGARLPPSNNASAERHELGVGTGTVRIEVTLLTPVPPGSFWELDFSSSEGLVEGSLQSEGGSVVASDGRRIVFRLNGDRGETFRLRLLVR